MAGTLEDALGKIHDDVALIATDGHQSEGMGKLVQDLNADKVSFNQNWNQITAKTSQELQTVLLPQLDLTGASINSLDVDHGGLAFTTDTGKAVKVDDKGKVDQVGDVVVGEDGSIKTQWSDGSKTVSYINGDLDRGGNVTTYKDGSRNIDTTDGNETHVLPNGQADKITLEKEDTYTNENGKWVHRTKEGALDNGKAPDSVEVGKDDSSVTLKWADKTSDKTYPNGYAVHSDADGSKTITDALNTQTHVNAEGKVDKVINEEGDYYAKNGDTWTHYQKGGVADKKQAPSSVELGNDGAVTFKWPDKSTDIYYQNGKTEHVTAEGKHSSVVPFSPVVISHKSEKTDGKPSDKTDNKTDNKTDDKTSDKPTVDHTGHRKWSEDHKDAKKQSLEDIKADDTHTVQRGDTFWDMSANSLKAHGNDNPTAAQIAAEMDRIEAKPENKGKISDRGNIKIGTEIDFSKDTDGGSDSKPVDKKPAATKPVDADQDNDKTTPNQPAKQHTKPTEKRTEPTEPAKPAKPPEKAAENTKPAQTADVVTGSSGQIIHFDGKGRDQNHISEIDYPNGTSVKVTKRDGQGLPTEMQIAGNNQDCTLVRQQDGSYQKYVGGQPTTDYVDSFQINPTDGSAVLHGHGKKGIGPLSVPVVGTMTIKADGTVNQSIG